MRSMRDHYAQLTAVRSSSSTSSVRNSRARQRAPRHSLCEEEQAYQAALKAAQKQYDSMHALGLCRPDPGGWIKLSTGARCTAQFKEVILDIESELRKWR